MAELTAATNFELDKIHEECGVLGIFDARGDIATMAYMGLDALQHRGQDAAGILISDGDLISGIKDTGLVVEVFGMEGQNVAGLPQGHIANAHTRYTTTKAQDSRRAAGPNEAGESETELVLSHNGHVINTFELMERFGVSPDEAVTDSDLLTKIIHKRTTQTGKDLLDIIPDVLEHVEGSFALTINDKNRLFAVRDKHGLRPLLYGETETGGHAFASEKGALDAMGASLVRDVSPGEMMVVDELGVSSHQIFEPNQKTCIFEYVYLSRTDNEIDGVSMQLARQEMGRELARQALLDVDLVIGVPTSGEAAALGYSQESGIPLGQAFVKNRSGRTYIALADRTAKVNAKFNINRQVVKGKRIGVVDDSLVRGTTLEVLGKKLRRAGAVEVHGLISSPRIIEPCDYGVVFNELIANELGEEEVLKKLHLDTLTHIRLDRLNKAIGSTSTCDACMTGDYPTPVEFLESRVQRR